MSRFLEHVYLPIWFAKAVLHKDSTRSSLSFSLVATAKYADWFYLIVAFLLLLICTKILISHLGIICRNYSKSSDRGIGVDSQQGIGCMHDSDIHTDRKQSPHVPLAFALHSVAAAAASHPLRERTRQRQRAAAAAPSMVAVEHQSAAERTSGRSSFD